MDSVSRRTFLKTSALAAAATATANAKAAPNDRIQAAVIGCRNRGHKDAEYFLRTGDFDIVSLCDCDSAMIDRAMDELDEKLERKPKVEEDFRRVLDDPSVEAVIIATPDHWHALMTDMALEAGKHVYCEKPASFNIADGKVMVAAQRRHPDLVLSVGTQQRSGQHFKDAKQFIDEGGLGTIGFVRAWITHTRESIEKTPNTKPPKSLNYDLWVGPAPMHPYNENRCHYNWHWVRDYGTGEMGNWGAHWIDVARWLADLDLPAAVSGHGGTFVTHDIKEWPDTQTVIYEFPETTLLWEQRLWAEFPSKRGMRNGVECGGEKGTILIDRGGWEFFPREGSPERHRASELSVAHAKNFADSIRGDAKPSAPIVEGHKSAVMCHLGNITAVLNRRVVFDAESERIVNDDEAAAWEHRAYRDPWEFPRDTYETA